MKKVLGLDIGTNSIGWALVHEPGHEGETYHIAGMGVRIVPLSPDDSDEFTKGNAISKNAKRTAMRGARRNLQRYKLRRQSLTTLLKTLGMMPDKPLFGLTALSLYQLRHRGVTGQLTLPQLGRVWFHLNQKRGYKSNRKANNEEEQTTDTKPLETPTADEGRIKKKGYLDLINDREQALKDEGITIGQHFYNKLLQYNELVAFNNSPLPQPVRIKEEIYLRSTYMEEFDRIWTKQQTYYPEVLTDDNRRKIRDEVIYYQRPLRSQKGLVSNCLFEKHHKAAPKSSPLFQVNKIWQELNNIELTSFKAMCSPESGFDKQGKRKLTLEEKQRLFALLTVKGKMSTKELLKELGYKTELTEYKLNIRNEKELEGNRTYAQIKKVFDDFEVNYDYLLQFNLQVNTIETLDKQTGEVFTQLQVDAGFEKQPLFRLWHLLYSVEEAESLILGLQKRYGFTAEIAKELAKIDFAKQGYGSLSPKALRNIIPYLQQGLMYAKACDAIRQFKIVSYIANGKSKPEAENLAGYNHSNSLTDEQNTSRKIEDKLKNIEKGELRQPVVEKILNQVINLVNALIDEQNGYVTREERLNGTFAIRVELARELRQNADERNKAYKRNTAAQRENNNIVQLLQKEYHYKHVSRALLEKYKLYQQFNGISIYTGQGMSLAQCLNGDGYDVDHIIPQAVLFDDSFQNKVLCEARINRDKDKTTGFDFVSSQLPHRLEAYIAQVKKLYDEKKITKAKRDKLLMPMDKIPKDFIERQLQETRYISRTITGLLRKVCRHVHLTSGTVTAKLRRLWGWDDVLMRLQLNAYKSLHQTEWVEYKANGELKNVERIKDWTKREDHRHHAIDALTIACTQQGFVQRINTLNSQETRNEMVDMLKSTDTGRKAKLLERYLINQRPFDTAAVQSTAGQILISFKSGKRLSSKSRNTIKKGRQVIHQKTEIIPRGFLHKETIYGRIKQFEEAVLSPRFSHLPDVVNPDVKAQIVNHIAKFDGNIKTAFNSKNLLEFKEQTGYSKVTVYRHEHVVRYKLDTNFKAGDINYIIDKAVREKVQDHLELHGGNPKIAFNSENPVWMNKEKGIQVKTVRCFTGYTDLQPLHQNEHGQPIDFVSTRNNHHMAIYRDENGKLQDNTVTFWDAVKRRKAGIPVVITEPRALWDEILNAGTDDQELLSGLPPPDWNYLTSLQQNELFVFGLTEEELELAINTNNNSLISKHLYRTQKMSKKSSGAIDLWFRHHSETKLDDSTTAKNLKKFINVTSLGSMNGLKVKIDNIGRITKIS